MSSSELNRAAAALNAHGFTACVCSAREEAAQKILADIGAASVGMGDSLTLEQLGVYERLNAAGNVTYWHRYIAEEEKPPIARAATKADVYLTGSNAVTLDGKLVNIDGNANRVAGMVFGPPKLIVVAGRNKLAEDYDAAILRIQTQACGKNARRYGLSTPCAKADKCFDCASPQRMCRVVLSMERPPTGREVLVYLIDEDMGY